MIRTLLSLLPEGSRRTVVAHLLFTIAGIVLRAVSAVLLMPLLVALFSEEPSSAWLWLSLLVGTTIAGWITDWWGAQYGLRLGFGILDSGQRRVADHLTRLRRSWYTGEHTATARQAVAATGPDLVGLIIYLVTPMIGAVLLPITIAACLMVIAWPLGVAALIGVAVLLAAFWLSGVLSRDADRAAAQASSRLAERVLEFARTQQALRAARRVDPARSLVGAALDRQHSAAMRTLATQIPGHILFGLASQIALVLLAGTAVALSIAGTITVPEAIALIVVIVRYLESFTVLAELSPGIESTTGALRRIREVLDAPQDPSGSERLAADRAVAIEFHDVRFGYGGDDNVLDGFSLTLDAGSTTAIVGPSGSGKSTVLALIAGLQYPESGEVRIDGTPVADLEPDARRALVSMVFQHPYLFDGTVAENVRVGDPSATEEARHAAARLARVDTLVARLPDGWGSRVGEGGGSLSGGERQRVSIARALLKPAPILLVDEATSALDTENETAVASALTADPTSRTRVIVAHRLSSIRAADRVLFLEDGRIVEDGSIPELLARGGRFAEFWQQQGAARTWKIGRERSSADAPDELD